MLAFLLALAPAGAARAAEAVADAARSEVAVGWFGRSLALDLALDRAVPFRVFTLDRPPRLVADFEGLDWSGFDPAAVAGAAEGLRVGRIGAGWARLVYALPGPLALETAELVPEAGGMRLAVRLGRVTPDAFAARSGAPPGVWPAGAASARRPGAAGSGQGPLVAIDPGHGGIDPGAVRGDVLEKDVVLAFSEALRGALIAEGFRVVMTREDDSFLALDARTEAARAAGADLLISIHSNVVDDPSAKGAIAFVLSERGSSAAAVARAARENAADTTAGLDGVAAADPVGAALAEIARRETGARSHALAAAIVARLAATGDVAVQPLQSANFRVLATADLPAVLLEIGFLSNPDDRAAMLAPGWRAETAAAVSAALADWGLTIR